MSRHFMPTLIHRKDCRKMIRFGLRKEHSFRSMGWWCGGFTIIGIREDRMGLRRGWEKYQRSDNEHLFVMPETTVKNLAEQVAKTLGSPVVRYVGNPKMNVTKVALSPGSEGFKSETHTLERDDVEVLLVGETVEWETVEYVDDAVAEGRRKALVVIGHIPSEQAGMEECTRWLKGFV